MRCFICRELGRTPIALPGSVLDPGNPGWAVELRDALEGVACGLCRTRAIAVVEMARDNARRLQLRGCSFCGGPTPCTRT